MVSHSKQSADSSVNVDIRQWLDKIRPGRSDEEMQVIERACEVARQAHAGQTRLSGEPYFNHVLAVADILADLRLDHETLAAALLHDVAEDTAIDKEQLRKQFGDNIANLVDGVTKMQLIQVFQGSADKNKSDKTKKERAQAESLRKMLLAMAEDIRVVLIKLADRTHNMRTLAALRPDKQQRIARETLDIYAPLANRLGIWQVKWELEDLSLRYLDPELYMKIARLLDERRVDREAYIHRFIHTLDSALRKEDLHAEISGRPKHIYSIWRKMEQKGIDYHQLYDVRGVRILVEEISECYTALGVVHSLWQYIPGEFDDYIATPKENNYRSIHTAIIGPEGKIVEVQIRTHEMHRQNELGVAAHWRYKEGSEVSQRFDEKISWLRQLLEWKDDVADAGDFVAQVKRDVFEERIYVFTPRGNVVDLAHGATPLDFAYHIHTEVGHRCRGAKVNGKMVPLTYQLQTGEQVEIITVKSGTPSRDWLNPHLGYLNTSRARSKVQQWFRHLDYDDNVAAGRQILERELRRVGYTNIRFEALAEKLGFDDSDDLFAAIAHNEVKSSRYLGAVQEMVRPAREETDEIVPAARRQTRRKEVNRGITVNGVGDLMTNMARCCNPVPGDAIAGYITRGHGVSIHRQDCPNMQRYGKMAPERVVDVNWGDETRDEEYPVMILITAFDRQGLLRDITSILANEKINLIAANTLSDVDGGMARMRLTIEITDLNSLSRILGKIAQLKNVTDVTREIQ
jgi:GTP pyrophosphokinase